ncbi:MAG: ATP-binding protein [Candidatus Eremiobacteraeota bacterium]|nr:ATP-binding protein [Candidatus Eremiobacteraeota bacterium]
MDGEMTKLVELRLQCNPLNIRVVREHVHRLATELGYSSREIFHIELVVDEACVNAIEHGSSATCSMDFIIGFHRTEKNLIILVKDFGGRTFNPNYFERICKQKTWRKGGKGIHIIKELMDEVMYILNPGSFTTLCMVKRLPGFEDPNAPEPSSCEA